MGVVKLADYRPQLEVVEHRVADTDLQERLSVRDMYNLLEIISVESFNKRVWNKHQEQR